MDPTTMDERLDHAELRCRLNRSCGWCLYAAVSLLWTTGLCGVEPLTPTPLGQQIDGLIGPRDSGEEHRLPYVQIPSQMQQAGDELRLRKAESALTRQREILNRLDELLSSSTSQSQQRTSPQTTSGEMAGINSDATSASGTETGGPQDGPARESSSGAPGTRRAAAVLEHRRNLATAVWGHLPDREREQMLQAYQEEFLPDFADLVERYYEALAAERLSNSPPLQSQPMSTQR